MRKTVNTFDIFVIGTGTAGQTAVSELLHPSGKDRQAPGRGLRIGIADKRPFGGTCALRGCQPKKYLVVPTHAALAARALTERGFHSAPRLDWQKMHQSLQTFVAPIPSGTKAGLEKKGVRCFTGHCEFTSPTKLVCGQDTITAETFVIATGARPRPLPIKGAEYAVCSDDFLALPNLPERIVFIGAGYISMEFACVAAAAGASVTVLNNGKRILEPFDADTVKILEDACNARGIDIRNGVSVAEIRKNGTGCFEVQIEGGDTIAADLVVGAIGRVPNIENLGLEKAGVAFNERGIETDAYMRTSHHQIYAIGDCVQGIQLAPVSDLEARVAARNIINPMSETVDLDPLPSVVFSYPQIAAVGMSEKTALKESNVRVAKGSGAGWPNYRRLNESHVGYKVIIDEDTDTLLGAHLIGPWAGELINLFALAMKNGIPTKQLKELPWAYPTYGADIKYMFG